MSDLPIHSSETADPEVFYPVRLTSRTVTRKRARRLCWLGLGSSFGLGCALAFSSSFSPSSWFSEPSAVVASTENAAPKAPPAPVKLAEKAPVPTPVQVAKNTPPAAPAPVILKTPAPTADSTKLAALAPASQGPVTKTTAADVQHYPLDLTLEVQDGDTLISMLTDSGVSYEEAHNVYKSVSRTFNPKKLDVGQNIAIRLEKAKSGTAPVIASLSLPVSLTQALRLTRTGRDAQYASFNVKQINVPLEHRIAHVGGHIENSLYETGQEIGLPASMLGEIISAYSYDVDFQRDIKQGDAVEVMYDKLQTRDGHDAGNGNLMFAQLSLGDRVLKLYRYADKDGNVDYYNEKGESIRKALLRTPVNGARITSTFGMRMHPLLGYTKMHRGVDFGAPVGTPIYAAGDGVVEFTGIKGGYGNYLRIRHNNTYATAYAHISRFASGMAPGRKVKQGQIVAYVGATGMATGPHLHYEILVNNDQVNPASVKFKTGNVLAGRELTAFRQNVRKVDSQLASLPQNGGKLAMNETAKKKAVD